jgi:zinc transporter
MILSTHMAELRAAPTAASTAGLHLQPLPGLVWAFRLDADGTAKELAVDQPMAEHHAGWLWLHFNLADTRACQLLRSIADLPASARELLVTADEHQQLHVKEACVFGIFADLVCGLHGVTEEIGFLHFAMTETLLISCRRPMLNAVEATRQALRKGRKVANVAGLLETIVEHVVDAVDNYAERLAGELDQIEERILVDDMSGDRQVLGRVRRTAVRQHRQLAILRSLIHRFEQDIGQHANPAFRLVTDRLAQRLDWLDNEVVGLRDRAHLLQEEVMLKTAEQTNRNLQVLAIVTTVFLPASLVASIFGMNVKGLPLTEDDSGFVWSLVLLVGVSAVVFWLLKRSGILGR